MQFVEFVTTAGLVAPAEWSKSSSARPTRQHFERLSEFPLPIPDDAH